jgi:hypothetical protein
MKHIKLFEEFSAVNEGAINVFPAGNPYKPEGSIQWTGVLSNIEKWKQKEGLTNFVLVLDLDPDMYTANSEFRSKALGTWKDKNLPLFTEKNPKYNEVEFDLVGVEENMEKPNEPWLRVVDKKGLEFLVPPFKVLDIQKGASVKDGIQPGSFYLVDKMRAKIIDYKKGNVVLKMQDSSLKSVPIEQWKKAGYVELDENEGRIAFPDINEEESSVE